MHQLPITSPSSDEYAPFYAGYVAAVADEAIGALLEAQSARVRARCERLG